MSASYPFPIHPFVTADKMSKNIQILLIGGKIKTLVQFKMFHTAWVRYVWGEIESDRQCTEYGCQIVIGYLSGAAYLKREKGRSQSIF